MSATQLLHSIVHNFANLIWPDHFLFAKGAWNQTMCIVPASQDLRSLVVTGISVRVDQYFHENYGPAGLTIPGKLAGLEKSFPTDREYSLAMLFSFCTSALQ